jgi:hypothetical protein
VKIFVGNLEVLNELICGFVRKLVKLGQIC